MDTTNQSINRKWRAYCQKSGKNISFKDFCEIENRYASERISKENMRDAGNFLNDTGILKGGQTENVANNNPAKTVDENIVQAEQEEEKIFGMSKKAVLFIAIAILFLGGGLYLYLSNRGKADATMPGANNNAGENAGENNASTQPATAPATETSVS